MGSNCSLATTVTVAALGIDAGAEDIPVAVMVPHPAPVQLHVTAVDEVPVTAAVNCWVPPAFSDTVVGETDTVVVAGSGLPHPMSGNVTDDNTLTRRARCTRVSMTAPFERWHVATAGGGSCASAPPSPAGQRERGPAGARLGFNCGGLSSRTCYVAGTTVM